MTSREYDMTPSTAAARRILCVFADQALADASCLGSDGWTDYTDVGACQFVPALLGTAMPAADALIGILRGNLCTPATAQQWKSLLVATTAARRPIDLVAADEAVGVYIWMATHLSDFTGLFHQDDQVTLGLPSWWRRRYELHLSAVGAAAQPAPTNATTTIFNPDAVRAARAKIYPDLR